MTENHKRRKKKPRENLKKMKMEKRKYVIKNSLKRKN